MSYLTCRIDVFNDTSFYSLNGMLQDLTHARRTIRFPISLSGRLCLTASKVLHGGEFSYQKWATTRLQVLSFSQRVPNKDPSRLTKIANLVRVR
jgi:hypothetical protein